MKIKSTSCSKIIPVIESHKKSTQIKTTNDPNSEFLIKYKVSPPLTSFPSNLDLSIGAGLIFSA
ncbi:hypothetical protein [Methanobacterium ferruginis]|uniref:hypothetical protein n=1 Tax=Methanobacterium ferruginis TaxID=710191 RepID=UPI002573D2BE|nr:hypothetical protein [Methanobacterium ferruginis]